MKNGLKKNAIKEDAITLTSKEMEGRLSGTTGAFKAATYLSNRLFELGYYPLPYAKDYLQPVSVFASRLVGEPLLKIGDTFIKHRVHFAEYNQVSSGGIVFGELVVVKEEDSVNEEMIDGKIVLISERPEGFDLKGTVEGAIKLGVKALLVEAGEPKWFLKTVFGPKNNNIPVLKIRKSVLKEIEWRAGQQVEINLPLQNSTLPCHNVIGFFPGEKTEDTIVLSAHYDHLGDDPNGYRFPGAIDNVSGVVTLLEIARLLANRSTKLPFNIVIAFFSGEESGLQGAYQFLKSFSKPIMAAINFDCLGQEDEVRLARIGYAEPSHWLPRVGKKVMESYGIEIKWKDYDGEDSVAFRKRDIPALGLGQKTDTTGVSIHTPDDEIDSLSLVALETWSKLAFNIIEEISSLKPYL